MSDEQQRIQNIVRIARDGVHVGDPSMLRGFFFSEGVMTAFRALSLDHDSHSSTPESIWAWCQQQSPHDFERLYAGLGFIGAECRTDPECLDCRLYLWCTSRFDPRNTADECGE